MNDLNINDEKKQKRRRNRHRLSIYLDWVMVAAFPIMLVWMTKRAMYDDVDMAAVKAMSQLLEMGEGWRLFSLFFFYTLGLLGIFAAVIYIGFSIFGYRLSFRREDKSIWHI